MPINHPKRGYHPYYNYHDRHYKKPRGKRKWFIFLLPMGLAALCMYWYVQPLGTVSSKAKVLSVQTPAKVTLSWPATSQASIGTVNQGVLMSKPGQIARPIASTAKLITVLTILKHKPLKIAEQGPTITLTQSDVDIYNQYFSKNGSLAKVEVGEKLTQHQMLAGILLPSANNYADTLAIWAFGSLEKYKIAAQQLVKELDMNQTSIGSDASGFSPDTTSTAEDLTKLAVAAMKNKVIADIVSKDQVDLPVAGVKQNTNWLLGADGVVGIKTGNTDEAGGVYVFASIYKIDENHSTTIVGAVQGEPNVIAAIHQARLIIQQAKSNFRLEKVIKKGQVIATYSSPWSKKVDAIAASDIDILVWKATEIKPTIKMKDINAPAAKDKKVGSIKVGDVSTDVVLEGPLDSPNWQWRMLRWL